MLLEATLLVDLIAMAACLWMAFYLFARGFPSKITLRGSILLLSLSAFFFSAYNNLFEQIPGTAAWRAVFLIVGLIAWHEITLQLLSKDVRHRHLRWTVAVYLLGGISMLLLLGAENSFIGEKGNNLYVAHMGVGLPYILYGSFEIITLTAIHYNLLAYDRVGLTLAGRYFLFASLFALAGILYGIVALTLSAPMPRIIQDLMVFSGVFTIGVSVARHQAMVERRTTLQDFPVTSLTILLLAIAYVLISIRLKLPLALLGPLVAFVVLTHALYDLVREFLERLRIRDEGTFRRQLRELENEKSTEDTLRLRLEQGLNLLCNTLDSSSGYIAVKRGDEFVVTASRHSVEVERHFPSSDLVYDDISHTQNMHFPDIQYFAPSFDGQTQIALVGIGKPKTRLDYSHGDLELFSEVADQIGTIVSLSNAQSLHQVITQSELNENNANMIADEMLDTLGHKPDQEFVKLVEEGLRHFSDYIVLGQSPLADMLDIKAGSHIERGRELQKTLLDSIELLRPAEKRPPEPLPRVWYNHAVLHDAYVEGVPNREIMARLYISEGTFNRTRRNAIRGLARLLMEKNPVVK